MESDKTSREPGNRCAGHIETRFGASSYDRGVGEGEGAAYQPRPPTVKKEGTLPIHTEEIRGKLGWSVICITSFSFAQPSSPRSLRLPKIDFGRCRAAPSKLDTARVRLRVRGQERRLRGREWRDKRGGRKEEREREIEGEGERKRES